jgi:hypothetical protein
MNNKFIKIINGVARQVEEDFFLGTNTSTSSNQTPKSYDPSEFEDLIERFRTEPEDNLISIVISDKWGSEKGVLKAQLDKGFHFIIKKAMLEKIKSASLLQNTPSTFSHCFGTPIIEDDDLAEKIVVEAYYRANPFPVWVKGYDSYFSDCES